MVARMVAANLGRSSPNSRMPNDSTIFADHARIAKGCLFFVLGRRNADGTWGSRSGERQFLQTLQVAALLSKLSGGNKTYLHAMLGKARAWLENVLVDPSVRNVERPYLAVPLVGDIGLKASWEAPQFRLIIDDQTRPLWERMVVGYGVMRGGSFLPGVEPVDLQPSLLRLADRILSLSEPFGDGLAFRSETYSPHMVTLAALYLETIAITFPGSPRCQDLLVASRKLVRHVVLHDRLEHDSLSVSRAAYALIDLVALRDEQSRSLVREQGQILSNVILRVFRAEVDGAMKSDQSGRQALETHDDRLYATFLALRAILGVNEGNASFWREFALLQTNEVARTQWSRMRALASRLRPYRRFAFLGAALVTVLLAGYLILNDPREYSVLVLLALAGFLATMLYERPKNGHHS